MPWAARLRARFPHPQRVPVVLCVRVDPGKGGKSFKSGKNRSEEKRDLEAKDEGQGASRVVFDSANHPTPNSHVPSAQHGVAF